MSQEFASIEHLLDEKIVRAVKDMGFTQLSPIQEQAIPALLEGRDIIGQAQTGTGKTAAFGIPVLQNIDPELRKLQAIILCPTRELAIQACEELRKIAKYMQGIKVLPIYGGQEIIKQITGLRGVQIIVGTPGRVMDHMRRHTIKMDHVKMVVLDEADEMLNMGFREDMELILGQIEQEHQTALFSATMPQPILEITGKFQRDAQMIKVAAKELTIPLVSQRYYRIKNQDKDRATLRILEYYQPKLALVFCNTKVKVEELTGYLKEKGYQAEGLHGDMSQHLRDAAMNRFRSGISTILIATDVAARGIDVDNVEAVINYDIPQDIEYYVHRIGRTGRAGKTGRSFTFVSGREVFRVREIERVCKTTIEEQQMPTASKVMRSKAHKKLEEIWAYKDSTDMDIMQKYIERKMDEENCTAMEIAAAFLKASIGEIDEDIEADVYRKPERSRFGRRDGKPGEEGKSRRRDGKPGEEGKSRRREGKPGEEGRSRRRDGKPGEEGKSRRHDTRPAEEGKARRHDSRPTEGRGFRRHEEKGENTGKPVMPKKLRRDGSAQPERKKYGSFRKKSE